MLNASCYNAEQRFPIGTVFRPVGKSSDWIVVDYHITRNVAGDIVKARYVGQTVRFSQPIVDADMCETTVARGVERLGGAL
jgi:hypothetical protein